MASDLPDIDQSLSFVVDDGEAVGPFALTEIARSIAAGERPRNVFVWWVGAHEWVPFNSDMRLVMLLPEPVVTRPRFATTPPVVIEVAEEVPADEPVMIDLLQVEQVVEDQIQLVDLSEPEPEHADIDLVEIPVSASSVLADVGARLDALAAASRHSRSSIRLDRAGASPVAQSNDVTIESVTDDSPSEVRASTLDGRFDVMARQTLEYKQLSEQSGRVRELLARACAAAISRQGYSVERRTELEGHYHLGFESGVDTRRLRLDISPAPSVTGNESQYVHCVMSWGRMAFDIDEALQAVQKQLPVADRRAGSISSDAELDTGSVYTRVELVLSVEDYVGNDFSIDRDALEESLAATQNALEQRWYELFIPAE